MNDIEEQRRWDATMKAAATGRWNDDEDLSKLKQAAFEILLNNPGYEMNDWQQELISNYGNLLVDVYGSDPSDVYASLDDLRESPYYDSASGLEYDFQDWAMVFTTEQSVRMYRDMVQRMNKTNSSN